MEKEVEREERKNVSQWRPEKEEPEMEDPAEDQAGPEEAEEDGGWEEEEGPGVADPKSLAKFAKNRPHPKDFPIGRWASTSLVWPGNQIGASRFESQGDNLGREHLQLF